MSTQRGARFRARLLRRLFGIRSPAGLDLTRTEWREIDEHWRAGWADGQRWAERGLREQRWPS